MQKKKVSSAPDAKKAQRVKRRSAAASQLETPTEQDLKKQRKEHYAQVRKKELETKFSSEDKKNLEAQTQEYLDNLPKSKLQDTFWKDKHKNQKAETLNRISHGRKVGEEISQTNREVIPNQPKKLVKTQKIQISKTVVSDVNQYDTRIQAELNELEKIFAKIDKLCSETATKTERALN